MKTIGLLGGMSWESTIEYYKILNEEINNRLGGHHSAKILLYSIDFEIIKNEHFAQNWNEVARLLTEPALKLQEAGADAIVICTNTMHLVADKVQEKLSIPIIHIVKETGKKASEKKLKKVGLLGTKDTMEKPLYKNIFKDQFGIDIIVPDESDRVLVNTIIYDELVMGKITNPSKENYLAIISKLIEKGAEGIILGCTEIPLLIKEKDVSVPIFDTTMIHAMAAIDFMVK